MASVLVPDRAEEFAELVKAHTTSLLRMCFLYLGDLMLAEDAVQETFIKAYEAFKNFRGECAERTWLTRIAINTCKNMLRSPWRRRVSRVITPGDLPEAAYDDCYQDETLTLSVMRLPAKLKEVVLMYYYREYTLSEIGDILSISANTAAARLSRARKQLKHMLKEWDEYA